MVLHTTLVTSIHTGLEELDYRHLLAYANASRSNYAINKLQVVSTHGIFGGSLIVGFAKDETREGYLEFGFNWLDPVQGGAPVPRSVTFDVNLKKKSAPQITIKSDDSNRSWLTTDVLNFAIEVILSSFDDVHNRFAHRFTPRRIKRKTKGAKFLTPMLRTRSVRSTNLDDAQTGGLFTSEFVKLCKRLAINYQ